MSKVTSRSLSDTKSFAQSLLKRLSASSHKGAAVLGLCGDLGAGKTALTKQLALLLGVKDVVNSPTFILEKIYKTSHPKFKHLVHIDAYRLEGTSELSHLGFAELVSDPHNIIVIEWAERVESLVPEDALRVHAEFVDEGTRHFQINEKENRGK